MNAEKWHHSEIRIAISDAAHMSSIKEGIPGLFAVYNT